MSTSLQRAVVLIESQHDSSHWNRQAKSKHIADRPGPHWRTGSKGIQMGKILLISISLLILASAVLALLKAIAAMTLLAMGLVLAAGLYRVRPAAFYALCITAIGALLPKAVWPLVGIATAVWLLFELVQAVRNRFRGPKISRADPVWALVLQTKE